MPRVLSEKDSCWSSEGSLFGARVNRKSPSACDPPLSRRRGRWNCVPESEAKSDSEELSTEPRSFDDANVQPRSRRDSMLSIEDSKSVSELDDAKSEASSGFDEPSFDRESVSSESDSQERWLPPLNPLLHDDQLDALERRIGRIGQGLEKGRSEEGLDFTKLYTPPQRLQRASTPRNQRECLSTPFNTPMAPRSVIREHLTPGERSLRSAAERLTNQIAEERLSPRMNNAQALQRQIRDLKESGREVLARHDTLVQRNEKLAKHVATLERKIQATKRRRRSSGIDDRIAEMTVNHSKLAKENSQLRKHRRLIMTAIKSAVSKSNSLEEKCEQLKATVDQVSTEKRELTDRLLSVLKKHTKVSARAVQFKKALEKVIEEKTFLERQVAQLEANVKASEEQRQLNSDHRKALSNEYLNIITEHTDSKNREKALAEKFKDLLEEKTFLESENAKMTEERNGLLKDREDLTNQLLEAKALDDIAFSEQKSVLEGRNHALELRIDSLEREIDEAAVTSDRLRVRAEGLEVELETLNEQRQIAEKQNRALRKEIAQLEKKNRKLCRDVGTLVALKAQGQKDVKTEQQKNRKLQKEIAEVKERAEASEALVCLVSEEKLDLRDKFEDQIEKLHRDNESDVHKLNLEKSHLEARVERLRERFETLEREVICPICEESNKDAVIIPCGHRYCRGCIVRIKAHHGKCPECRQNIVHLMRTY